MPEFLLALVIAGIFAAFGLTTFPDFHTMLLSIDITSLPPLVKAMATAMPYVILFAIVYVIILVLSHRTQK